MKLLRLLPVLFALLCTNNFTFAGNTMYRVLGNEIPVYDNWKGNQKIGSVHKGDTLYATKATQAFIEEREGTRYNRIPLAIEGKNGWVSCNGIYPIKGADTDSLKFVSNSSLSSRTVLEREFVPLLEWSMNGTKNPVGLLSLVAITMVLAGIFAWIGNKGSKIRPFLRGLTALLLVIASIAEINYILAFYNNAIWFIWPSMVGWGRVIINFIITVLIIGLQIYLFAKIWGVSTNRYYDYGDISFVDGGLRDDSWLIRFGYYPPILGVIMMIMHIFDHGWSGIPYIIALATLIIPAIYGLIYNVKDKNLTRGFLYSLYYVVAGTGLTITTVFLSYVSLLVIIVVGALAIVLYIGAKAGRKSKKVTYTTIDGRKHRGTLMSDGTLYGDNGNKYKI